jgi:NADPH:quinone reductase-like Zn-dependent oxidoreductase
VKGAHPKGIDAVIDLVGNATTLLHLSDVLRAGGRVVSSIHAADEAAFRTRSMRASNFDLLGTTGGMDDIARSVTAGLMIPLARAYPLEASAEARAAVVPGMPAGRSS